MSKKERDEKRRDSKGRLLKSGESQRTDGRTSQTFLLPFMFSLSNVVQTVVHSAHSMRLGLPGRSLTLAAC